MVIAGFLVEYAKKHSSPLSMVALHHWLFMAHGVYLTHYCKPLFTEDFRAFSTGPRLVSVQYHIQETHQEGGDFVGFPTTLGPPLTTKEKDFLEELFYEKKDNTKFNLLSILQKKLSPSKREGGVISNQEIRDLFLRLN